MIARFLAALLLVYLLCYAAFAVGLPEPAEGPKTDAIVVLTGGSQRLQRGLDLLQDGWAKRMLVSGVAREVRPQELAHRYQADQKLFDCCIDLGREAIDTRSNAQEVSRWVERHGFKTVRLITTDWHMPRARFELSRRIPDGVTLTGDAVRSDPRFLQLFTEYNKYLLRVAAVTIGI